MNPLSLRATNYRSFPDLDLDLPTGCVAILGQNGAGKSSIVNAIDLAIFGPQSRSLADALSDTAPDDDLLLELELEHGGSLYRIRRTYSPRGRGKTTLDFERDAVAGAAASLWEPLTRASARETQELIEQTIGLSRETFRASAFLAQGDGSAFTEAQPRTRKAILAEVLGLDRWNALLALARADLRTAEQSLALVKAKIENAETELAERPGLALLLDQAKANEQTARASLDECGAQLAKARERLAALREAAGLREAAERALASADREAANLRERISGLERQIAQADERLAEREKLEALAEGLPRLERERDALTEQARGYGERDRLSLEEERWHKTEHAEREKAEEARAKAHRIVEAVGSEHCDRCGQVLGEDAARAAFDSLADEAKTHDEAAGAAKDEILAVKAAMLKLPILAPDYDRAAKVADLIRLGRDAQTKLAALAEVEAGRAAAHDELEKVRAELPEREAAVGHARAELDALAPHDPQALQVAQWQLDQAETKTNGAQFSLSQAQQEIARLDERLERLDKIAAETKTLTADRDRLQADLDVLAQLERAFSPNGIPALIVENSAIPYLETEATRILAALGTTYRVELRTQAALRSGDGLRDTLDVIVVGDHGDRPYETFSGGERTRINLALRIALARLLAHRRGAESRLLAIDEPEFLDEQGTAALVEVLRGLEGDFDRLYLISHVPALKDAFDQVLTVVKDETGSRVMDGYEVEVEAAVA